MRWVIYPGMLLLYLLFITLHEPCNQEAVAAWCALAGATWLCGATHAHFWAKRTLDSVSARSLTRELQLIYAFEGAVWGALPWVTLDSCSSGIGSLSIAINAGVAASRMMLLASVPTVSLPYILVGGAVWIAKTISFPGLPGYALGMIGALYVVTLIFQARVHARTLTTSIRLRFENQVLLDELNRQMVIADSARVEAEDANRSKSQFLAAVSHDLRQPAQAQGLFLNILQRTALDERQRKLVENIAAAASASADMLSTLLDFSRIEAGVVHPHLQDFRLQTILNRIESEFGAQADAKGLVYRTIETGLVVHADPLLVDLILRNLVSNAIRYTQRGGLLVGCRRRGGEVSLEVWDTGIGIAPEHRKDVFREFLQLNNPERDRHKGLGLGLAIVEGLARRLGSRIELASRPGRGTVFRLRLPIGDEIVEQVAKPISDAPLNGARILVIDDDEIVRFAMHQLLNDWGCQCEVVESIEEAIERARQNVPAVIISDYRLRGTKTGADAIAALRREHGHTLPALLITGDTAPDRLHEAAASGIPLLHKPVQPEILRRQIEGLLSAA